MLDGGIIFCQALGIVKMVLWGVQYRPQAVVDEPSPTSSQPKGGTGDWRQGGGVGRGGSIVLTKTEKQP